MVKDMIDVTKFDVICDSGQISISIYMFLVVINEFIFGDEQLVQHFLWPPCIKMSVFNVN